MTIAAMTGHDVESIAVALIGLPRMLSDIVTNVVEPEPDLRLVQGTDSEPVPQADVAITRIDGGDLPVGLQESLCVHHYTRVLALSDDGRRACVYKLQPARTELGEVSQASLLAAIRGRE